MIIFATVVLFCTVNVIKSFYTFTKLPDKVTAKVLNNFQTRDYANGGSFTYTRVQVINPVEWNTLTIDVLVSKPNPKGEIVTLTKNYFLGFNLTH